MKYRVHVYATFRHAVEVEAESQQAAIHATSPDLEQFSVPDKLEYADEITAYMVDEIGDEEHERTRNYDRFGHLEADGEARAKKVLEHLAALNTIEFLVERWVRDGEPGDGDQLAYASMEAMQALFAGLKK